MAGVIGIRHCVIHRLPKRLSRPQASPEPELSDVESELGSDVALFLARRISDNLADAYVVDFDPLSKSPVPGLIDEFFRDPSVLVRISREMAFNLHACQPPVSPAGLLMVAELSIDQRLALAILKVEEEDGLQIAKREELKDQRGYKMVLREDLFLTQKTRVYKVGKFELVAGSLEGRVLDKQQGTGTLVAGFFLKKFLGCRFGTRADLTTQAFMDAAESFFNAKVADSSTRARYEIALLSEMQSHSPNIRVRQFAAAHLDLDDRAAFEHAIVDAGVPTNVPKDVSLITNRIEAIQWLFEDGISVVAPPASAQRVSAESLNDETARTRLTIEGRLRRTSGRGKR